MKKPIIVLSSLLLLTSFRAAAVEPMESASMVIEVQEALSIRGYPVLLSGELDPATREALRQFQVNNGIHPPSGLINEETLRELRIEPPLAQ